ncbi:MAG: tripartite tricarboxylate transporter substrate binding protein [Sheuella sp.]|nr:tripartite tricarboxylate transporter substrate binding protein [Sheuella sp.]
MINWFRICVLAIVCSAFFGIAHAQAEFKPTAPVKIIVAFPPGGGTDAVSRILAERLTELWRQQVVVENKAGAQGNIGTAFASKAPADGYTMMIAHQGVLTVNPHLYKDMGFDPFKDIVPVARVTQQPFVLVAHPSVPAKNLKELEALAKSRPGKLNYGSSATGPQLAVELFKYSTGTDLMHIAYKGAGPAVVDLLGGNIDLLVANPTSVAQHVKSGKLNAIVLFGKDPVSVLPGVPTAIDAGYPILSDIPEWYGLAVPGGTPEKIVAQLNHDINLVLNDPAVKKRISDLGLNASPTTPADFSQQIRRDYDRWGELIKKADIKGQ